MTRLAPEGSRLAPAGMPFAKGHGTENDFVLVPDLDGRFDLTPALVVALCDRQAGIGGNGVIRVVRSAALPDHPELPDHPDMPDRPELPRAAGLADGAEWFMDYRNADGSAAEMCGNGIRVFVAYLHHLGLVDLRDGEALPVGTRAGVLSVRRDGDLLAADLGPWRIVGGEEAVAAGYDTDVSVRGIAPDGTAGAGALTLPGLSVNVGNPHTVLALPGLAALAAADLAAAPHVEPVPAAGTNVELTVPLHESGAGIGHLRMRVHERGVGETRSCGTGAAAAVLATRAWAGPAAPRIWWVDVPGGRLRVTVGSDDVLAGPGVELAGPAVIVAEGSLHPDWLTRARSAAAGADRLPV